MPSPAEKPLPRVEVFDEKQFYLDEFRGRSLLFSVPVDALVREGDYECLAGLVRELVLNDSRVILWVNTADPSRGEQALRRLQRRLGPLVFRDDILPLFSERRGRGTAFMQAEPHAFDTPASATALLTAVWLTLRRGPLCVGVVAGADHAAATLFAQQVAARLRVHKWVLIDPDGGVTGTNGEQLSFMDETMLETVLGAGEAEWAGLAARRPTFVAVRAALLGGVASVNLCTLEGTPRELFTYRGSGTLFTLADYCRVERLGIDDFEEVERLIARGHHEGLLKLRGPDEVAGMLINGYGATIGAHHLAGICALTTEPYAAECAGEIVGLYTITRFKGEGVGGRLLARVLADARAAGLAYVFAATTAERAQTFFERQGFRRVGVDDVPVAKWVSYDPHRKARVAVFRLDLVPEPSTAGERRDGERRR